MDKKLIDLECLCAALSIFKDNIGQAEPYTILDESIPTLTDGVPHTIGSGTLLDGWREVRCGDRVSVIGWDDEGNETAILTMQVMTERYVGEHKEFKEIVLVDFADRKAYRLYGEHQYVPELLPIQTYQI